jgi:glutamyl-tRNA reductase
MNKPSEISEIICIGMSYKSASVEMREKFPIEEQCRNDFLLRLKSCDIDEVVYLSTCNRAEIYFSSAYVHQKTNAVINEIADYTGINPDLLYNHIYIKKSRDAVLHLLIP